MSCIAFDIGGYEPRMVIVEPVPGDEVPDDPTATLAVVVEVHEALLRNYGRTADNYSPVTLASVIVIVLLDGHGSQRDDCIVDLSSLV